MIKFFDYCVSNPPYQESGISDSSNNSANNIFQFFYKNGFLISDRLTMIFPGGRWMQKTSKCKNYALYLYSTISSVEWFPNGGEINRPQVFDNIVIRDGVSIVIAMKDNISCKNIKYNGFVVKRPINTTIYPLDKNEFNVVKKIQSVNNKNINWREFHRMLFGLRSYFVERNPDKVLQNIDGLDESFVSDSYVVGFVGNATPGSAKRVEKFWIDKDSVKWDSVNLQIFNNWKVIGVQGSVSKTPSNGGYKIVPPQMVVGESYVVVGSFYTEVEAKNYLKYLQSFFVKFLLDAGKGGKIEHWGCFVPELEDYSNNNPIFKADEELDLDHEFYGLDLDHRLYSFFGICYEDLFIN